MREFKFRTEYDALIVGARCAGAATAMLLARRGLKVLLIDRDAPGTDTMSTHALMRGAVMQLNRWGLLDTLLKSGAPAVRKTTFFYGDDVLPLPIKPGNGVDMLIAPRRNVLDATLVAAAREAEADVRHGTALKYIVRSPGSDRVCGAVLTGAGGQEFEISARIVIGADGRRSTVARHVGAIDRDLRAATSGCVYAYFDGMKDDGYRWYYNSGVTAGAIPTNDGAHCVFASVRDDEFRALRKATDRNAILENLARRCRVGLGEEVANANPGTTPVFFSGAPSHLRESAGPGWALVGDAGYFKDPNTAHGITDALRDAEILANAVIQGSDAALKEYEHTRDALSSELLDITERIASFEWTLPELQSVHMALNNVMKDEQAWMEEAFAPLPAVA